MRQILISGALAAAATARIRTSTRGFVMDQVGNIGIALLVICVVVVLVMVVAIGFDSNI